MLGWRLTISTILIPLLLAVFWLDHRQGPDAPFLLVFSLILAARAAWELCDLLKTRAMHPNLAFNLVGSMAIVGAAWLGRAWPGIFPATASSIIAVGGMSLLFVYLSILRAGVIFREPGHTMESLGADLIVLWYCGILLALTSQLRWIGDGTLGYAALGSVIVVTKCGDIGGYTLGRLFGKRKMAPWLSPGKTWAGFVGAILGAAAASWAWGRFGIPIVASVPVTTSLVNCLLFGVLMGVVGLVGDLCESLVKRDVGRKDAAALFPGFGGLLDLLDSVVFAGPVAWVWWNFLPLAAKAAQNSG